MTSHRAKGAAAGARTAALSLAAVAVALLVPAVADAGPHPTLGTDRCDKCHTTGGWDKLPENIEFDHAATGYPLVGFHARTGCIKCHGSGLKDANKTPTDCARCHEDRHGGELGRNCEQCHSPKGFKIPRAIVDHRATRFPLVGAHIAADCTACHQRGREQTYRGVSTQCFACHANDYRRTDVHPNHVTSGFTTSCDFCHTQYTWEMPRFRHQLFFPLIGAHSAVTCTGCHQGERYGGTPTACEGCHMADYNAASDPPHRANRMPTNCDRCHSPVSWEALAGSFHEASFPITSGHHSGFTCKQCHPATGNYLDFSCMVCHGRSGTAGAHGDVGGYVYENFACFACHPRGEH